MQDFLAENYLGNNEYTVVLNDGTEVIHEPFQISYQKAAPGKCFTCNLPTTTPCLQHRVDCPYSCNYAEPVSIFDGTLILLALAGAWILKNFIKSSI